MRRGMAREDVFAVGIDIAMTESMAHCDVVLPAATHFEYADLYPSYGHHWLQRAEPVIAPLGESLPIPRSSAGWPRASALPSRASRQATMS